MYLKLILYSTIEEVIKNNVNKIIKKLKEKKIAIKGPINFPKKKTIINILRSPHKNKNSQEQLEINKIKKILIIKNINKIVIKEIIKTTVNPLIKLNMKFVNDS